MFAAKAFLRAHAPLAIYDAARGIKRRLSSALGRSYHDIYADRAARLCTLKGARALVVGANTGGDCRLLINRGAAEVHGIDVIDDVGKGYPHERVIYRKTSIEHADLPSDYFDLVFTVATMEHVNDVRAGFSEIGRVTRPGGMIFSVAAPLWQSPYGHHMGCFEGHPWAHLVFGRDALIDYAKSQGITGERGHAVEDIADYMLSPANFNMLPASEYLDACAQMRGVSVQQNDLTFEPEAMLGHELGRQALARGYRKNDLLAVTHTFVARKLG